MANVSPSDIRSAASRVSSGVSSEATKLGTLISELNSLNTEYLALKAWDGKELESERKISYVTREVDSRQSITKKITRKTFAKISGGEDLGSLVSQANKIKSDCDAYIKSINGYASRAYEAADYIDDRLVKIGSALSGLSGVAMSGVSGGVIGASKIDGAPSRVTGGPIGTSKIGEAPSRVTGGPIGTSKIPGAAGGVIGDPIGTSKIPGAAGGVIGGPIGASKIDGAPSRVTGGPIGTSKIGEAPSRVTGGPIGTSKIPGGGKNVLGGSSIGIAAAGVARGAATAMAKGKTSESRTTVTPSQSSKTPDAMQGDPRFQAPSRTTVTPSQGKLPASRTKVTPSQGKLPASRTTVTPSQGKLPASRTKVTPSQGKLPVKETNTPKNTSTSTSTSSGSSSTTSSGSAATGVGSVIASQAPVASYSSQSNTSTVPDVPSYDEEIVTPATDNEVITPVVDQEIVTPATDNEVITPVVVQEASEYSSIPNTGVGGKSSNNHLFPAAVGAVLGATGLAASMLHKDDKEDENNTDEANVKD